MWKAFRNYFDLSARERRGMLLALILLVFLVIMQIWLRNKSYTTHQEDEAFDKTYAEFQTKLAAARHADSLEDNKPHWRQQEKEAEKELRLVAFDPNTASEATLDGLGLPPWVVRNIIKYRSKGGQFRQKKDLARIYGMKEDDFARIAPYIQLPDEYRKPDKAEKDFAQQDKEYEKPEKEYRKVLIDINLADSAQLTTVRGIGPAFAHRIVAYREKLGGFIRQEQLLEVYGLDSAKYEGMKDQLTFSLQLVHTININAAEWKELVNHPYINSKLANAIVNYRKQHGLYSKVEDVKKIVLMNDALYEKLAPYLQVN